MNSIHDLGGMDGFGPITVEADEPVFHHRWEGEARAVMWTGLATGTFNIDEFRHAIERMAPAAYLSSSYYERWLSAIERLYVEKGVLTREELTSRRAAFEADEAGLPDRDDPGRFGELAAGLVDAYAHDTPHEPVTPRYTEGDSVRVTNTHPGGHTRCPRYVRRATGVIADHYGTESLPDASAHGTQHAEPLYNVRFTATELWGPDADPNATIHLDLWESYLEPTTPP